MSTQTQEENPRLSSSLLENLIYFRSQFDGSFDFVVREFQITGTPAALFSLEGMVNKHVAGGKRTQPDFIRPAGGAGSMAEIPVYPGQFLFHRGSGAACGQGRGIRPVSQWLCGIGHRRLRQDVGVWRTGVPVPQRIRTQRRGNPAGFPGRVCGALADQYVADPPPHENPQAEI